ncbi:MULTISPECIES: glycosyltransferase [unclassified Ruegeria]|uniref:glycosyltransferase family protein n=1 Tax=unclassified Ruegeria TaxID=2625375 RepID=UPI001491A498|nr:MULTISPECIES: glycosyltransferase [unclassified Ruegeria]NOD88832.1 glycosyltransferase [Ruegeria sp. HKCCD4318]NOE14582.1 glycosyltransferase [Ruegeria sp. HKCCD4318-2]NOG09897.1 glycosyltransferase [Ruegeria sp. HKCCD4315]
MRKAKGHPYTEVLAGLHRRMKPNWYLEIGTQTGRSLTLSQTNSVAVDPEFRLKRNVLKGKEQLFLMQQTSDDFFSSSFIANTGARFDLAFLDGMHLFEVLLRDFMNSERLMAPEGRIVMKNFLPWTTNMANRDRSTVETRDWTGDVWKIVPILREYRPDLKLELYDAAPTGIIVVEKLDPTNRVLQEKYNEICSVYGDRSDCEATVNSFELTPTSKCPWINNNESFNLAIKLPVPRPRVQNRWGDYHFGVALMEALQRAGHRARVQTRKHWDVVETPDEIDLVLRGGAKYAPVPGRRTLFWLMSKPGLSKREIAGGDHFFVAGKPALDDVASHVELERTSLLPQAFDPKRMVPPKTVTDRGSAVFVGIARSGRPMVRYALETQCDIRLWGNGWEHTDASKLLVSARVPNEDLPSVYRSASAVLNDHTPTMCSAGIPSNRIFDALACATPVITDDVGWFPEDIKPYLYIVRDKTDFAEAIVAARDERIDRRIERIAFAHQMRHRHSFDARAATIIERINAL